MGTNYTQKHSWDCVNSEYASYVGRVGKGAVLIGNKQIYLLIHSHTKIQTLDFIYQYRYSKYKNPLTRMALSTVHSSADDIVCIKFYKTNGSQQTSINAE